MRRLPICIAAVLMLAPTLLFQPSVGVAQDKTPFGVAIADVTASSDCSITYRTYATLSFDSEVVDEQVRSCPAGTVIMTTPVDSAQAALILGGIFVPLSGDPDVDFNGIQSAKAQLLPTDTRPYALEQNTLTACQEGGFSAGLSYYAPQPGVYVYSTVYYWQTYECDSGITSSEAWLNWNADLWWRSAA